MWHQRLANRVIVNWGKAHHPVDSAHALEVIFGQVTQTNVLQEIFLPSLDAPIDTNRHVPLLTDHAAEASLFVACSNVRKGIPQIIELASVKKLLGHVVLEPKHLGDLHLNGHLATDIAEQVVVGSIDLRGFLDWTVIQPQDHVAVRIEVWARYRDRLVGIIGENRQGAGGIKPDTSDRVRVDIVLANSALNGDTDAMPDVGGRLFLEAR